MSTSKHSKTAPGKVPRDDLVDNPGIGATKGTKVGKADPDVTVGWDWVLEPCKGQARWRRVGLPRTNVLLVDNASRDYEWNKSLAVLGTVVDALPWQEQASEAIAVRYEPERPRQPPKVSSFAARLPSV